MFSSEGTATNGEQGGHTLSPLNQCSLHIPVMLTLCTGAGHVLQIVGCVSKLQHILVDSLPQIWEGMAK